MTLISVPEAGASKDEWREWARSVRAGLDMVELSSRICDGLVRFPPLRHEATVLTYLAMDGEIDLTELVESDLPVRWATTRTPEEGPLTIHELGGPVERHRFGFPQPVESAPRVSSADIDVVLVPGLAFDLYGNRLGHGLGYYDELLSRLRVGIVRVGVVPTTVVADRLPTEGHDVPVQWLAAEEGVVGVVY
jgi:5-formyltetrahydrofolate cyclo-ligase